MTLSRQPHLRAPTPRQAATQADVDHHMPSDDHGGTFARQTKLTRGARKRGLCSQRII